MPRLRAACDMLSLHGVSHLPGGLSRSGALPTAPPIQGSDRHAAEADEKERYMNTNGEFMSKPPGNDLGGFLTLANARLKKLRRERLLVERAIIALTELSRARHSRDRRARNF
jgi:hypothetical protein